MSIKQLNVKYFPNEERILFRMNTIDNCEYKFWLTRRVTHIILQAAGQFIEKEFVKKVPSVEGVISESNKADQQACFGEAFEPGQQYPLGVDALLIMDAKCEVEKSGEEDVFSLDLVLPGGGNVNLKLATPIMKKVTLLLEEANTQAQWGLC